MNFQNLLMNFQKKKDIIKEFFLEIKSCICKVEYEYPNINIGIREYNHFNLLF